MTTITPDSKMKEVLASFPGAQRTLFARYHIGGCQSCGFAPDETLAEVCQRNEDLPVNEVIEQIQAAHQADQRIQIEPSELSDALGSPCKPRLLDIRTREEYDAVNIPGSQLFTNELLQEVFATWDKENDIVVYDHRGERSLDATTFLIGHGFANAKALRGGIDAYAEEADPSLPRYRVEFED